MACFWGSQGYTEVLRICQLLLAVYQDKLC